jgi:hypothetical protein
MVTRKSALTKQGLGTWTVMFGIWFGQQEAVISTVMKLQVSCKWKYLTRWQNNQLLLFDCSFTVGYYHLLSTIYKPLLRKIKNNLFWHMTSCNVPKVLGNRLYLIFRVELYAESEIVWFRSDLAPWRWRQHISLKQWRRLTTKLSHVLRNSRSCVQNIRR